MKYNIAEIYQGRIEEIDRQLKGYIFKKQWYMVKKLKAEKERLEESIRKIQAKEHKK